MKVEERARRVVNRYRITDGPGVRLKDIVPADAGSLESADVDTP